MDVANISDVADLKGARQAIQSLTANELSVKT